jgi:hypothetical protein
MKIIRSTALLPPLFALAACAAGPGRPPREATPAPSEPADVRARLAARARDRDRDPAPEPRTAFVPRDVNHVLSTGQSLAVGVSGAPALTLAQPFGNLMFTTGVMAGDADLDAFAPLVEGDTIPGSKAVVETMSSSFANLVAAMARAGGEAHDVLVSVHASGAKPYALLKKGTRPYAVGMAQVTAAREVAARLGKSYVVRAVTTVHGESDHAEKNVHYEDDLRAWQADYEHDVQALTGQTEPVPLFETQMSSWTRMMRGTETSAIPEAQLAAHIHGGGKIVLVGPKYHLSYAKDGVHLTSEGYRHMGEDYAKAYRRVVLDGRRWEPLRPLEIAFDAKEGKVIRVRFVVPEPPIVLDTTLVSDPGSFGFEYTDESAAPPAIAKVEVTGPETVAITLAEAPTAPSGRLRYAFTGVRGARSGPTSGARGNLRDSDGTSSVARPGTPLYNWCVHFDEPVAEAPAL